VTSTVITQNKMNKTKIILIVIFGILVHFSIVAGGIFFTKSKVAEHVDKELSFNGLMILKDYKIGVAFKDNREIIQGNYCYTIPDGIVYEKLFGSDLLLRIDNKEKEKKSK